MMDFPQALRAHRSELLGTVAVLTGLSVFGAVVVPGFEVPLPVILLGVILGMTYGALAVGLVMVFRSSGVINLAHGEVGTFAASLFAVWAATRAAGGFGLPYWLMLPAAMAVGAATSMGVEVLAVRRLRHAPKFMSLVMTLGAAAILLIVASMVNTQIRSGAQYPRPPGMPTFSVGALAVTPEYTAMLVLTPLLVLGLAVFLSRSRVGIALRAASDNRDSALMAAIPADRMSSVAWAIAGAIAAFVAIMLFPQKGFVISGVALGPALLVRALLAAVVARLVSLPVAFLFGIVVGVVEQGALWNTDSGGPVELLLFITLLIVLLFQSREGSRESVGENWAAVRPWEPLSEAMRNTPRVRWTIGLAVIVGGLSFVLIGLISNQVALAFTFVIGYSLVGLSVYVITGLSGHLSLGQFALAGVGAVVSVRFVDEVMRSVPVGMLVAGLVCAAVSILIGLPALRIRGLLLAVTTLGFAVAAHAWLFPQPWALGSGVDPPVLVFLSDPIGSSREYYLFALPFLAAGLWMVRNVSRSGFGRILRAVRDNEDGARAFGIHATSRKLQAFAVAGFLAGVGGALYGHGLPRLGIDTFAAGHSITVVAIALIGGLAVVVGPVLGAIYMLALPALVRLDEVGLVASTIGWVILLLYFPGGLAQAFRPVRDWILEKVAGVEPAGAAVTPRPTTVLGQLEQAATVVPKRAGAEPGSVGDGAGRKSPLLTVHGLTKAFGGIQAVDEVDLAVHRGETLGVIGANGAGKTTLFGLVSGFTAPDRGSVWFADRDVTRCPPEERASRGLVRSFQDARLFPTLTVLESLQLATERMNPSRVLAALGAWPAEVMSDQRRRAQARELAVLMGLEQFCDKPISALSTGTRRITELAAIVALGPKLVLLDEPSSGIAQRETEALGGLLERLKLMVDTTFVIIEHDMPLITSISDRMIAMESGRIIADGIPDDVCNDPQVVHSYLGANEVAVARSGPARRRMRLKGPVPEPAPPALASKVAGAPGGTS